VDDTAVLDENGLRWGWDEKCSGTDIEASALYEVSDWLKRNENTPSERRRMFMEEILNRMVSSVKNGMLNADDGSRTIHEAAAILGLHLAEALPMATVVISGMRLTATANDLAGALREFGDIDVAAVAPGSKGFGIVRFRRPKSVDRAMRRYNTGEIIIQDVAVQMKVLMSTSLVDSRAPDIPDNT
jgi:RNA recognition motif. (a.k.a. RRM, RBD, or RNP domain)